MKRVPDAIWCAVAYCMHPRVFGLPLVPSLVPPLVPQLVLILPPLIVGWLSYRVFAFDASRLPPPDPAAR